jgi:hypothetical protein
MSEELDKARGAMNHARELNDANDRNERDGTFQAKRIEVEYLEAMKIAEVNAWIAMASALESIADQMGWLTNEVKYA